MASRGGTCISAEDSGDIRLLRGVVVYLWLKMVLEMPSWMPPDALQSIAAMLRPHCWRDHILLGDDVTPSRLSRMLALICGDLGLCKYHSNIEDRCTAMLVLRSY